MNTYRILLIVIIAYSLFGCRKNDISDLDNTLLDLTNTQWRFEKIVVKASNDANFYPKNLSPFDLSFQPNGELSVTGGCNYRYGSYSTEDQNTIVFSDLGPGTYLYCPELTEWETGIVWGIEEASTYRSDGARLIIANERHDFHFLRIP